MKTSTADVCRSEPGSGVSPAVWFAGITLRSREPNGALPSRLDAMRGVNAHGLDRARKVTAHSSKLGGTADKQLFVLIVYLG